jgi:hypothetical protein
MKQETMMPLDLQSLKHLYIKPRRGSLKRCQMRQNLSVSFLFIIFDNEHSLIQQYASICIGHGSIAHHGQMQGSTAL